MLAASLRLARVPPTGNKQKEGIAASGKAIDDLQGEWVVVATEGDGEKASADAVKGMKWVIKKNEITGSQPGSNGTMSFKLNTGKMPKEIDATAIDGNLKGTISLGTYTLEGRTLRVCFGVKRRPKEFSTGPSDGHTLITLEKAAITAWGEGSRWLASGLGFPLR